MVVVVVVSECHRHRNISVSMAHSFISISTTTMKTLLVLLLSLFVCLAEARFDLHAWTYGNATYAWSSIQGVVPMSLRKLPFHRDFQDYFVQCQGMKEPWLVSQSLPPMGPHDVCTVSPWIASHTWVLLGSQAMDHVETLEWPPEGYILTLHGAPEQWVEFRFLSTRADFRDYQSKASCKINAQGRRRMYVRMASDYDLHVRCE